MIITKYLRICLCLFLPWVCLAQTPNTGVSPETRIDQIMEKNYAAGDFNGTVLVARSGKVLYQHAFGLANREWSIPNDLGTKFEIGSMTKQFTALLVLQLVNEGKLRLDGNISDYLPYYRKDTASPHNPQRIAFAYLRSAQFH